MKLLIALAIALLVIPAAMAQDYPVLDRQVGIRVAHLAWITAIQEVSMEATVGYIDEISNGTGTAELNSLMTQFRSQQQAISGLTTHIGLNNALKQMIHITTQFRLEARRQIASHKGRNLVALGRVVSALANNKDELDALRDAYWSKMKTNSLEIFDIRVDLAQDILDTLEKRDYGVTEAQAKLDEIKALRSGLEQAIDDRDGIEIIRIHLDVWELSKELARIVRDLQVVVPEDRAVKFWINVGDRVVTRTGIIIDELDDLGMGVTELKSIHSDAQADLLEAKEEFNAGNISSSRSALQELRTDLIELRLAYEELIFSGVLPDGVEAKIETLTGTLESTTNDMEEEVA